MKLLVFEPKPGTDELVYRGWIDEGSILDDPTKYEFYPVPEDMILLEEQRFKVKETNG